VSLDTDVAVVGAGPVGLMLAAELRAWGIGVVVLEREVDPDTRLRAPAITERTIEALARHRLLDPLLRITERYRAELGIAEPALRADHRVDGTRLLPVRQDHVVGVLEDRVRALGCDVRRGHEVAGLASDDDHVDLRVRASRGAEHGLRAGWVVGCDGGRSAVRAAADIGFAGTDPTLTGYQAEVTVKDPSMMRRGWHRTPRGVAAYGLCPSRVVSIESGRVPPDRGAPVTLDEVQTSLRRTSGTDVTLCEPRSLTRFTDNARVAEGYRRGRVLLAGDAAHVHAPFGGQGLNLGVQDAVNLGWKLAATVRGWAPPGLLDSYDGERRPVAHEVLRNVRTAVALMDPEPRMTAVQELFDELRGLEPVRRHLHAKTAMVDLRYPAGGGAEQDEVLGRAPRDVEVRAGDDRMDLARVARAGRGLLLLAPRKGAALVALAEPWSDRIDTVAVEISWRSEKGVDGLLLRPDGHAIWVGRGGASSDERDALHAATEGWYGAPATG
jgi:2-polyprenyl-6-methoxyphenol hydroxylase-like FAD-dependent oxidoreductase